MPTYDYICLDCRKRFDVFLSYKDYGVAPVACSHCNSANVRRRVPRVRVLKSEEQRLSALADPSALVLQLGSQMDEELFASLLARPPPGVRRRGSSSAP